MASIVLEMIFKAVIWGGGGCDGGQVVSAILGCVQQHILQGI